MNQETPRVLSRGKFLKLSTRISLSLAGLLGLGGLVRYFSHRPDPGPPNIYNLGPADGFPPTGKLVRLDIPAVIYRHKEGFQAFSLICTHLGCTLEESGEGFSCPCHGSEFDWAGSLLKRRASAELEPLEVEVTEDGDLLIHTRGGLLWNAP